MKREITMSARQIPAAQAPLLDMVDGPTVASDNKSLGMFTGSGAIEAGCKSIVAQRAKQSDMRWAVNGAADIIALRCQHASGRWDELWANPSQGSPARAGLRTAI